MYAEWMSKLEDKSFFELIKDAFYINAKIRAIKKQMKTLDKIEKNLKFYNYLSKINNQDEMILYRRSRKDQEECMRNG